MFDRYENPLRIAFATALTCLAGCSSTASPENDRASDEAPASARPSEAERVQAFLDARSRPSDIRYSFNTALGQTVDCVDFFSTPGVRAMAERGEPITTLPTAPTPSVRHRRDGSTVVDRPQPAPASEGVDENGHDRLCPAGTVSQIRIRPEQIAWAGGLDAYLVAHRKRPPAELPKSTPDEAAPPATMWPCVSGEFHDYAHVQRDLVDNTPGIVSAGTEMSVYAPAVPSNTEHSLSQVWMFEGANAIDLSGSCTSNCVQSLEVGWQVDDDVPNNSGVADGVNPYVFIYSTLNGYMSGCWNGDTTDNGATCPAFIPFTQLPTTVVPGAKIAFHAPQTPNASNPATLPTEMHVFINDDGGNYWVQISTGGESYYIGYYPGSNYAHPMATFQVGGEAENSSNTFSGTGLQMGSGLAPSEGYGWAAYHHDSFADVLTLANGGSTTIYESGYMCASTPPGYSAAPYSYDTAASPGPSWANYFYYGGCIPETCNGGCGFRSNGCGELLFCGLCHRFDDVE
jgi:Neprosin